MKKDITKKFLGKENRYLGKMLSKGVVAFIIKNKINIDAKQIGYDGIEFRNVFSTQFIRPCNTKNIEIFGYKLRNIVEKEGKRIEFNMIYCDKGTFTMVSDDPKDKNPKKQVEIEKPFLLGEIEVTQELYELVMGHNPSNFKKKHKIGNLKAQHPVEKVTWYDAIMFCNKLSALNGKSPYYEIKGIKYEDKTQTNIKEANVKINEGANGFRLPSEQEWEYAAKAGTKNQYAGTNDVSKIEEYAWYCGNSNNSTQPIKTLLPNEWGFYDMSGNVYEWCWDKYDNNLVIRVVRGGSWSSDALPLRSANRNAISPYSRNDYLGFRVSAYL